MIKKFVLCIVFTLVIATLAWSQTRHTDYATGMEIKFCNECHVANNVEPNHGSFWMKDHRLYREKLPSNCNDCHQQSFCMDCHFGGGIDRDLHVSQSNVDYMPKTHRTDWKEIHPIKAFDDPRSCDRCHSVKEFCSPCHAKFNPNDLRFASHRRQFSDLPASAGGPKHSSFTVDQCATCHPNSVLPTHTWTDSHAREARKNLSSCQACHADGGICLKCHSAKTGLQINPHPKNWGKINNRLSSATNGKTCKICHK